MDSFEDDPILVQEHIPIQEAELEREELVHGQQ